MLVDCLSGDLKFFRSDPPDIRRVGLHLLENELADLFAPCPDPSHDASLSTGLTTIRGLFVNL
jgi:hypothetical protein